VLIKLFFKETSTCQLVHCFAIIAFLAFNNVQIHQRITTVVV